MNRTIAIMLGLTVAGMLAACVVVEHELGAWLVMGMLSR